MVLRSCQILQMRLGLVSPGTGSDFCEENSGAAQLDAGHSVGGTVPLECKLNKPQEACAVTIKCDKNTQIPSSKHLTDSLNPSRNAFIKS